MRGNYFLLLIRKGIISVWWGTPAWAYQIKKLKESTKQMSCVSQSTKVLTILNLHCNQFKSYPSAVWMSVSLGVWHHRVLVSSSFPFFGRLNSSCEWGIFGRKEGSIICFFPLPFACRQEYVMEAKGPSLCCILGGTNWCSNSLKRYNLQSVLGTGWNFV